MKTIAVIGAGTMGNGILKALILFQKQNKMALL
jgi:3-hydroxyacyl-CoA dehydrogenase